MEDFYNIEIITADNKKHYERVKALNDLEAIDMVQLKYKVMEKEIIDIKVV